MTVQDRFARFVREERARKLDAIENLEAGRTSMHEQQGAATVDVTQEGIRTLRGQIREIEQILGEAGIEFDA